MKQVSVVLLRTKVALFFVVFFRLNNDSIVTHINFASLQLTVGFAWLPLVALCAHLHSCPFEFDENGFPVLSKTSLE